MRKLPWLARGALACALAMLLLVVSPAQEPAKPPKVADLAWLAGAWKYETGGHTFEEVWLAPVGETMTGMGRHTRGDQHASHEFLRIAQIEGAIQYEAQPSSQKRTLFKLTELKDREVHFENPAHDFPTKVSYRREGDRLTARIEGVRGGKPAVIEFQFQKADLP